MSRSVPAPAWSAVPEIVRIVLTQATKFLAAGAIPQQQYEAQLERLCAEELRPRGWSLLIRELPDGSNRFVIRSQTETIDVIDCPRAQSRCCGTEMAPSSPGYSQAYS